MPTWSARSRAFLGERVAAVRGAGVARERIVVDPGIGFGKTQAHNLELLSRQRGTARARRAAARRLVAQVDLARLAGVWNGAGRSLGCAAGDARAASVAAALLAVQRGARIVRVHDVAATVAALAVWKAAPGRADNPGDQRQRRGSHTHEQNTTSAPTASAARSAPRRSRRTSCSASATRSARCCKRPSERRPTVLIGKDTRISGYMIESALEAGFASAGVDVLLTGPLPTPGVAYLTRALRLSLGVVISASHNPFPDNGIKFFSARGEKLPDDWERRVEAALDEPTALGRLGRPRQGAPRSTTPAAATSSSARAPSATTCR